jgi:flagellar assembly factor FliW
MSHLTTKYFGRLEVTEDAILQFPSGIPGFEGHKAFVLIERPDTHPLVFMQSMVAAELCFLALPVGSINPQYRLHLEPEELAMLQLPPSLQPAIGKDLLCLALVAMGQDTHPTVNLMAPIVVNLANRRAVQSIQAESGYSLQHALAPDRAEALC